MSAPFEAGALGRRARCLIWGAGNQCARCHGWQPRTRHEGWRAGSADVPENVDYETLVDAIRLTEALVHRLDERWLD